MELERYAGEPDVARLIGQVKGKKVDRVPHLEALIDDSHVEKILGRHAGNTLAYDGDPAKGSAGAAGRPMYGKDFVEFNRLVGQDVCIVESIWTPIKKRSEDGALLRITDRSVKTRRDWEQVILLGEADIEDRLRYVREYKEAVKGTHQGVMLLGCCIFTSLYEFIVGLTDFMMMCVEQRELVEQMLDVSADYFQKLVAGAVKEGIDILNFDDDVAWKKGLMLPPRLFKEIWLPRAQKVISPALDAGIPVLFHSDGRIDDIVESLIDIGIVCINPLDPYGIDYRDYKRRFGDRVALWGNVDVEYPLAHGTPQDVEKDVLVHMEVMKPGGRYVAGSSHSITNFVPHDNFIAMINATHRYGAY